MSREASLIAKTNSGLYLVQARDVIKPQFNRGEYPFIFPGACSLFGGTIEDNESGEEGFRREMSEELPGLTFPSLEYRLYNFGTQLDEVYGRINDTYHGNLPAFLGFGLNDLIPQEALGKANRGKKLTYRDWLAGVQEYHLYVGDIKQEDLNDIKLGEGSRILWLPEEAARALVMVPQDKLALLDEFAMRKYQS